jgi:butyryl-CoA dehydrogenase
LAAQDVEVFTADATLYLEFFGITVIAWQWLKQAVCAQKALEGSVSESDENFYRGKVVTARYFFEYELVKTVSLAERLTGSDRVTIEMQPDWF